MCQWPLESLRISETRYYSSCEGGRQRQKIFVRRLLTYAVANHEDETFRKTPLQWAVENHDEFSLIELLRKEREYHEDKEDGLYCLKYQLTNDLNLNLAISQFDGLYEKSACDKRLEVLPILIPLLISFVLYCTDVRYDITLSIQYRNLSQTVTSVPANDTVCFHRTTTPEMYGFAFMWTIAFACSSVVVASFIFMASKTLRPLCNNLWRRSRLRFALMLPLLLCPPLFLFAVYLVYAYRHGTSSKKSKERDNLELAEFLWTIVDIVEAGFEASGEIILQVWLLGPNILDIKDMGISELISGILFLEDSTVTQKSIGVIIIAVLSIVYCVGECYRVQKREAVNMFFDIIPIYISFLLQVVARIIAFSMFFSTSISANPDGHQGTYIFLALHISAVFLIKLRFSRHWRSDKIKKGRYEIAVMVFTDFASAVCSCLVYCDIRPMSIERRKRVEDEEGTTGPVEDIVAKAKEDHKLNTTFFTHFYFLLLVFVENIILTCWPHITNDDCVVDVTSLTALLFVVITLTVVSGLCNIFYYKVSGHPWAALNGIPVKMRFREIQSRTLDFFHLGCCKKTSVSVHGGELEARMPDEANEVRLELKPEETMGDGSPS